MEPAIAPESLSQAEKDVLAERRRQITEELFTVKHDVAVHQGELAIAGACYAENAGYALKMGRDETKTPGFPTTWPFSQDRWKPTTARRDLVKAAALCLAEIDRMDNDPYTKQN